MNRVYIFIDWWNFVLDWQDMMGKNVRVDWNVLPKAVVKQVCQKSGGTAEYAGTNIYASLRDQPPDAALSSFFNTLRGFEGYNVKTFARKSRTRPARCNKCKHEVKDCPQCSKPYTVSIEKGVDTALVTEMIKMAVDNVYDTGILGSTDSDLCGAVDFIQSRYGRKIYHLSFPNLGVELRNACWTHLKMDDLKNDLIYTST